VGYEALVADPLAEVERLYARLGWSCRAPPGSACAGGSAAITTAAVAPIGTP
jgi:hypothetical protein